LKFANVMPKNIFAVQSFSFFIYIGAFHIII